MYPQSRTKISRQFFAKKNYEKTEIASNIFKFVICVKLWTGMLEHPKSDHTIILPPPRARKPKNNIDFGGGGLKSKIIDIVDLFTYILSEIVDNVRR